MNPLRYIALLKNRAKYVKKRKEYDDKIKLIDEELKEEGVQGVPIRIIKGEEG